MYEIIDNEGTIFSSSSKEELREILEKIFDDDNEEEKYNIEWSGDLKLIKVLEVWN